MKLLRYYSTYRGRVPTLREAFARQPPIYWLGNLGLLAIVASHYAFVGGAPSLVFIGVLLGAVARDVGWALRFRRDWPTLDRVLNWSAVEAELAASSEEHNYVFKPTAEDGLRLFRTALGGGGLTRR